MSTLEKVVGRESTANWSSHKVPSFTPLAQFHTKFWGVEEEGGLSDNVDVDDSIDNDHEIDPRCYVLDIGIRGVEVEKIWVRADYIRIFKYAEKFYSKRLPASKSPCLVITGQPGIGEFC